MNSNRVLVIGLGCGVLAIVAALVWKHAPEPIEITSSTIVSDCESRAASSTVAHPSTELAHVETPTARDAASTAAPDAKAVTPEPVITPEESWAKKYAGLSSADLRLRQAELNNKVGELAQPDLQKMYDSGQYEMLHEGHESNMNEDWKPDAVMSVRMTPGIPGGAPAEVQRAILPEYKYPELYAMRHEERWLYNHASEVEFAEATAKQAASHK